MGVHAVGVHAVQEGIQRAAAASGAEVVGVAIHGLANGLETLINGDETFHAASTMKLPVMMEVYRLANQNRLSLDDRIPIHNGFASLADGSSYSLDPDDDSDRSLYSRIGESETVRELARIMIQVSGNLATNLLLEQVTPEAVNELACKLSAPGVVVRRGLMDMTALNRGINNTVTARGLMTLYVALMHGDAVSPKADQEMIQVLLGQKHRDGIPAGLPKGTPVAHKTGWFSGVHHDSGIVFPNSRAPYVLVILTRGIEDKSRSARLIADISRHVHRMQES